MRAGLRPQFFSESTSIEYQILDAFPGGAQNLWRMIVENIDPAFRLVDPFIAIQLIIKNELLDSKTLILWRDALQALPNFETNSHVIKAIGLLTLASKEIKHIAYVIDGDRRWAHKANVFLAQAHKKAFVTVIPDVARSIFNSGVHTFSVWYFKESNLFTRSKEEVIESILLNMIKALEVYLVMAKRLGIRVFRIGNKTCSHPDTDIRHNFQRLMEAFERVESETKQFSQHHLVIGANYDTDDDLLRAIKKMKAEQIDLDRLNPNELIKYTDMGSQTYPTPDLFLRSAMPGSGRVGAFLPKISETCIHFTKKFAPELTMDEIILGAAQFAHPLVRYKSAEHFNEPLIRSCL